MPIKYYLRPNSISPTPNSFAARINSGLIHNRESIIKEILKRGTTVNEADLRAAFNLEDMVISDEIAEGNTVNLPLVKFRPGIGGIFTSPADHYDASRHHKKVTISYGTLLKQKIEAATVEKITKPHNLPEIMGFTDVRTKSVNDIVSSGGIGELKGSWLKFNADNENEGIYFIAEDKTEIKATEIASRTDGKLIFNIPQNLPPGKYTLEVRKSYGVTKTTIHASRLKKILTRLIVFISFLWT